MIERIDFLKGDNGKTLKITCDNCKNFSVSSDIEEAYIVAQQYGWIIIKVNDEWEHYCPICSGKMEPHNS